MANRETIYRQFGPMMIEAIVILIFKEINILRQRAGLSERTVQQGIDALESELNSLEKYNWIKMGE